MEREVDCNHLSIPHYPIRGRAVPDHSTAEPVHYKSLAFLGYPKYRVGDDGSVWSSCRGNWKRLKTTKTNRGYSQVGLYQNGVMKSFVVYFLVLTAFVGLRPPGMEACHQDGNRRNDQLNNLRWDSHDNNEKDKIRHGTRMGEGIGNARLSEQNVRQIRKLYATGFYSLREIAEHFQVTKQQIRHIVIYQCWSWVREDG